MSTTASDSRPQSRNCDDSIKDHLNDLEALLDQAADRMFDPILFADVERECRLLHVRMRTHDAAARLETQDSKPAVAPELAEEFTRLCAEHPLIIGQLDRVIRCAESMSDRTLEDKDVFLLRVREVIALVRRHEAEDDRLLYLSVWRDTGGES